MKQLLDYIFLMLIGTLGTENNEGGVLWWHAMAWLASDRFLHLKAANFNEIFPLYII